MDIEGGCSLTLGCWKAARLMHRARRIGCQTACAESEGSVLANLWDPVAGLGSGGLLARVILRVSGFVGDGGDDHIVRAVLRQLASFHPLRKRALRSAEHAGKSVEEVSLSKLAGAVADFHCRNTVFLRSLEAQQAAGDIVVGHATVSEWDRKRFAWARDHDKGKVAEDDAEVFRQFTASVRPPALPLMPLHKRQRLRYSKLAESERKKMRARKPAVMRRQCIDELK